MRVPLVSLLVSLPAPLYLQLDLSVPHQLPVPHEEHVMFHHKAPEKREPLTLVHSETSRGSRPPGSVPLTARQGLHVEVREDAGHVTGALILHNEKAN